MDRNSHPLADWPIFQDGLLAEILESGNIILVLRLALEDFAHWGDLLGRDLDTDEDPAFRAGAAWTFASRRDILENDPLMGDPNGLQAAARRLRFIPGAECGR
jgi:hypothetical protein